MQIIARVDVRDQFRRDARRDFRRYVLLETWSPELVFEALRRDLDTGTVLPTTFAVYELADAETAVVVNEPFSVIAVESKWLPAMPLVADIADHARACIARILDRLFRVSSHHAPASPAA